MANFINFTGVIGSLRTRQVEAKHGTTTVCNISIANNQGQETVWFSKALWGAKAEAALRGLKKGDRVTVSGCFESQPWSRNGKSGTNNVLSPESIVIKASSSNAPLLARIGELEQNQRTLLALVQEMLPIIKEVGAIIALPSADADTASDADTDTGTDADTDEFEDFDHAQEDVAF